MKNNTHSRSIRELYAFRTEPEALLEFARFYWSILLVCAFILCSIGIGFGVWQYLEPLPESIDTGVTQKPLFESADLEKILSGLSVRAGEFEARHVMPAIKDPAVR